MILFADSKQAFHETTQLYFRRRNMRRNGLLVLGMVLALATCQQATAAVVGFGGVFTNQTLATGGGGASALGAVPPSVTFAMGVTVTDGAGPVGTITGGTIVNSFSNNAISIVGGSVTLTDGGVNDTAAFVVEVNGNGGGTTNGQMTFSFTGGDFFTGTAINQAAFQTLMHDKISTGITYLDFGNGQISSYTGTVTAVPEPSSMALMVGLVAGVAGWRRRRS